MPHSQPIWLYDDISVELAEVLARCARNRTEREIGEELAIATSTVHSRLAKLREVLGVSDKRELGTWWVEHREAWLQRVAERVEVELSA